jgi:hypothetical protein
VSATPDTTVLVVTSEELVGCPLRSLVLVSPAEISGGLVGSDPGTSEPVDCPSLTLPFVGLDVPFFMAAGTSVGST